MFREALKNYNMGRSYHGWIEDMFEKAGFNPNKTECNWCGIFMAFLAKQCGYMPPFSPETARSWQEFGTQVKKPKIGDVVVLWREVPNSWKGHVGLFTSFGVDGKIYLLGGNQGHVRGVSITGYDKKRILQYRRI